MTGTRPAPSSTFRTNYPGVQERRGGLGATGSNGYRNRYNGSRGNRTYFHGPWANWNGATFIGYPGGLGFDDGGGSGNDSTYGSNDQAPAGDGSQGPYAEAPDQGQSMPGQSMPYPPNPQYPTTPADASQATPQPVREPQPEDAVTLIFKDGRPAEQIHNYMLTRTTLYVRDQHHREISLADLDLAATKKANKDQGVDFQLLPQSSQ